MTTRADREAQAFADKAAESVQEWQDRNIAMGGVCDVCASPFAKLGEVPITYVTGEIQGAAVSVGERDGGVGVVEFGWDPYWAICSRCSPVVDQGDPAVLADWAIEHRDKVIVGPIADLDGLRKDLITLYQAFYAGEPRRES